MYLLFKLIKTLNNPSLRAEEWELIANIYAKLESKNFDAFEGEFLKTNPPSGTVAEFMRCFFGIIEELKELNSLIDPAIVPEDDRLLIISSMLPGDMDLMKTAALKIECLSRVSMKDDATNHLLRFFLSTISRKARALQSQPLAPRENTLSQEQIQELSNKIFKRLLVNKLKYLCTEYRNHVASHIGLYLKKKDPLCYAFYSIGGKQPDIIKLMYEEAAAIQFGAAMMTITPELKQLLQQCSKADSIVSILQGKLKFIDGIGNSIERDIKTDEEKLNLFADRYRMHSDDFKTQSYLLNQSSSSLFSYSNPLEAEFLKACDAVTAQVMGESMEYRI